MAVQDSRERALGERLRTKMIRFNSSGRAVTGDMLLKQDDDGKLKGKRGIEQVDR